MSIFPLVVLILLAALAWRAAILSPHGTSRVGTLKALLGHTTLDMTRDGARIAGVDRTSAHAVADPARSLKTRV